MQKTTMLEYSKIILERVSFNRKLFLKEYRKLSKQLPDDETTELRTWVKANLWPVAETRIMQ